MRKGIILFTSLIIILILLVGVIPLVDGYFFKSTFLNQLNALSQETANESVKFDVKQYQLGWLKSDLKLRVLSTDPELNKEFPNGITVEYKISHGPWVYDDVAKQYVFAYAILTSDIYLPPEIEMMILGKQSNKPILKMQTIVSFNDTWAQHVSIEPISIPGMGAIKFADSTGLTSFKLVNDVLYGMNLSGTIGAITVTADKNNPLIPDALIQPISLSQKLARQDIGLWNSDSDAKFPGIAINWKDGNGVNLEKLELSSVHGIDANKVYNASFNLSTGKFEVKYTDKNIPSIVNSKFNVAVNNLNPAAINDYLNYMMNLDKTKAVSMNQEEQNKMQQQFLNIITLKSNVTANVDINTSLGLLSLKSKTYLQEGTPTPITLPDLEKNVIVETNARISAPLLFYFESESLKSKLADAPPQALMQGESPLNLSAGTQKNEKNSVMQQKMVDLIQEGKISLQVSIQVLDVAGKNLPVETFAANIKSIVTPEVANQLTQAYQAQLSANTSSASPQADMAQQAAPAPLTADQIPQAAQKKIDDLVAQGILIKDNNDYVINLIYQNNVYKINGKEIPPSVVMQTLP